MALYRLYNTTLISKALKYGGTCTLTRDYKQFLRTTHTFKFTSGTCLLPTPSHRASPHFGRY